MTPRMNRIEMPTGQRRRPTARDSSPTREYLIVRIETIAATTATAIRGRDFRRDFKFGQGCEPRPRDYHHGAEQYFLPQPDCGTAISSCRYNGQRIRSQDDFGRFVVYEPGRRVPVVVYRDGREETIYVVYDNNDAAQAPTGGSPLFGADFDPQSNDGAVIIRVQKGGPADRAGLQENDLVVALNGEQVADGRQAIDMVNRMQSGDRVEVEFMRHTRTEVTLGGRRGGVRHAILSQSMTEETSVATGVNTDQTQRDTRSRSER